MLSYKYHMKSAAMDGQQNPAGLITIPTLLALLLSISHYGVSVHAFEHKCPDPNNIACDTVLMKPPTPTAYTMEGQSSSLQSDTHIEVNNIVDISTGHGGANQLPPPPKVPANSTSDIPTGTPIHVPQPIVSHLPSTSTTHIPPGVHVPEQSTVAVSNLQQLPPNNILSGGPNSIHDIMGSNVNGGGLPGGIPGTPQNPTNLPTPPNIPNMPLDPSGLTDEQKRVAGSGNKIPPGVNLDDGKTLPQGMTQEDIDRMKSDPSKIPKGIDPKNLPKEFPKGLPFTKIPAGFKFSQIPEGFKFTKIPEGFQFTKIPEGFVIPPGMELPGGMQLPLGKLPAGFMPPGVKLPDLPNNTMQGNGFNFTSKRKKKRTRRRMGATAISSTIPAVLITSVVFLYLYNW